MGSRLSCIFCIVGAFSVIGCSPEIAPIIGTITIDKSPLKKGIIIFTDQKGGTVTADVVDGKYEARLLLGKMRVSISEPLPGEKKKEYDDPKAPWVETTIEGLPQHYNVKSDLAYDVVAGPNTKDWQLQRKSRKE